MNPPTKHFFFDAHLDLSMNAMEWNRDLRWSISEIRASEEGMTDKPDRGNGMVNFESLRQGNVGMVVGTQIARYAKRNSGFPGKSWNSPAQAWAQTQGQLAWYRAMAADDHIRFITNKTDLERHLEEWETQTASTPIGLIQSLEGADSILSLRHLEKAYEGGLRAIGPAHYGPGVYAYGTDSEGGIGQKGRELLKEMERLGIILDATHLCDQSFWEAMDHFNGAVWASHSNCRSLVPHNRQFSDEQLKVLIERGAVIGSVFDTWMLSPNWTKGISTPISENITLDTVIDHMDHICQLAGNAQHVAIGSDLDGAFGKEQSPADMDTISDLQKLPLLLKNRGYSDQEITGICSGNWLRFLRVNWK